MKNVQQILIVVIALILASLACGTFEVGIETPTTEESSIIVVDNQEPNSDVVSTIKETNPSLDEIEDEPEYTIPTMAYIGPDNNIWVLEAGSETPHQVTLDANLGGEGTNIEYMNPSLSSDGTLLAYSLLVGTPSDSGHDSTYGMWVLNLATGEQRQILDGRSGGFSWKPGTHILTYGIGLDLEYFTSLNDPDSNLSTGIYAIDLDSDETLELVAPERGYALAGPKWSLNGRFLAFAEVYNMEGSGLFAYYEIEGQEFIAWDEAVGNTSWSPDGSLLTYTRDIYVATGDERLYLRPRQGSEQLLGPNYDGPAYATQPVFSPTGDHIAYRANLDGPMTDMASVMVIDLTGGEPKSLGQFEDVWEMLWVPNGSHIVFSFGIYPSRQIIAVNIFDGSQTILAAGDQPSLAGQ